VVLVDCMTLWLSNWLCEYEENDWLIERDRFLDKMQRYPGQCIIVSNEVGSGIVPMGELSRQFVDHAGWLNQRLAAISDHVVLVVAGCALPLKVS